MENTNKMKLFGKIALEYRLSLENLCKLMKLESTEENKDLVYQGIINTCNNDEDKINRYKYLFNYETINESENASSKSYRQALIFLTRYVNAKKRENENAVNEVLKGLTKTDRDFKELIQKDLFQKLTSEEATIISKYRIKYCFSQLEMAKILNFSTKKLSIGEQKIEDVVVREKLKELSDYYTDITKNTYRK